MMGTKINFSKRQIFFFFTTRSTKAFRCLLLHVSVQQYTVFSAIAVQKYLG